ncbi:MAG: peptidoglycan-associated lipoprotein Pal [Desulfobacula sp.]|mgnify:FL=1|jgi:peptidoglycan-associated lipoprotein|uniref:peptidoglycan-associated lipoprotein Pal n=1 Tax=Desulfobacula sp. TaxID=2593537 RepID=UPI001DE64CB7|nr:peptidoglycan-associated lipoprotein Pal [Desulfobacula sp.]MBT3485174.1 peptidoglycan-associated lipoprotein Pal [Desulfobacula sp.]MBT3804081.1 peptidoglycan-associated lipoprotein Pal [Desulfobacula sp.]MBT4025378.1 peptidoglycan-associated lipoprotein Pal [Desulfobacula sp.]MBT4199470.1 peptidoglycan-associated lipoprotein Pal [Desulfobacula sp.]
MKNRVWINLLMAILVAGLFLTASCAKKTVVTDATTIEDQEKAKLEADAKAKLEADAKKEAERIAQQKLVDQMANDKAQKEAQVLAAKKRFVNQDIHFEYDSSQLTAMAKTGLKEKAVWLKANPSVIVSIEGHCDERGTTEYNLALGDRRANTVKSYMGNLGVAAYRLKTISYGEEMPIDSGKTESAFRKNRRAHFAIN